MSTIAKRVPTPTLPPALSRAIGSRRSARLRAIIRRTGLPPEPLLDLAIEMLDLASRKLSPPPIRRTAVGLGAARWRNISPEERSELLRRVVQARWEKHKRGSTESGGT